MRFSRPDSEFVQHEPCPQCGSKDNAGRYTNGDLYCFGCKKTVERGGTITEVQDTQPKDWTPLEGEYVDLPARKLNEADLKFWGYKVSVERGAQIANYYDPVTRELLFQKLRFKDKQFKINGNGGKGAPFYGMWLWQSGKHLTITEGEIDAISVSKAMQHKWPVWSLPNGSGSAEDAVEHWYAELDRFDRIVLMFDNDKAGREAVERMAPLLPPGKVAIATLPEKDPNDVLRNVGPEAIVKAFWNAPMWSPDGIVDGAELSLDMLMQGASQGYPFPYPILQERILGIRKGELTLWTAGSGIGKSTIVREQGYHLHENHGCYVGNVFLEEGNAKTGQAYIAIDNNVPLGKLRFNPSLLTREQWSKSRERVIAQGMWFYNHFGSLESKNLITKLRYLATVRKVDFILLDHISIVTSGMESSSEGERKDIDILMTRLRQLIEETGVGIIAIVHLKRVTGKSFNEGGQVSLSDLRGSGSLEQLSDNVIALERDQQSDEPTKMLVRVLKCRETGETGVADTLDYNRATGRVVLAEATSKFPDDDSEAF